MKAWSSALLLAAPLLLLPGCASTQKAAYGDTPAHTPENIVEDSAYVALVEKIAKQRGTRVVWVNPPKKRVSGNVAAASQ